MDAKASRVETSPDFERIMGLMQSMPEETETEVPIGTWSPMPGSIVPRLQQLPDADDPNLLELLKRLHVASRPLKRLSHAKLWPSYMKASWGAACKRFTPVLKKALDSNDPLELTQALLDLLELPTISLSPFLPRPRPAKESYRDLKHPDVPGSERGGEPLLRTATSLAHQDLPGKAMQVIASNGIASNTLEIRDILQRMHPTRQHPLKKHESKIRSVKITPKAAKRHLYSQACIDNSSIGCFGWSAFMLLPIRGAKRLGRYVPFLSQLSRVVARIGSAEVPDVWGVILTCGGLFALHKLDLENQAERARAGLEPSVRPVNVGCCLLKWGLKLALLDDRVQVAIKRMQHIQKGFAKRGTETVAHLMRALAEKGYATLATDFTNGFNSLSRQKMLDAVQERCPELTQLFNTFYARDSMCFFPVGDDVHVIWSMEGSRMGCALGSLGFDFTVQPLYELMLSTYAEFVIEALTDDLTLSARLTAGDPEENVGVLRKLQGALTLLHKEAKRLNLQLKLSKCALYLPSAAGQFLLPAPAPAPLLSSAQPMISDCILAGALRVPLTPTHLQSQTLLLISSMLHAKDLAQLAVCSRSKRLKGCALLERQLEQTIFARPLCIRKCVRSSPSSNAYMAYTRRSACCFFGDADRSPSISWRKSPRPTSRWLTLRSLMMTWQPSSTAPSSRYRTNLRPWAAVKIGSPASRNVSACHFGTGAVAWLPWP
jgi:hypothetical protein